MNIKKAINILEDRILQGEKLKEDMSFEKYLIDELTAANHIMIEMIHYRKLYAKAETQYVQLLETVLILKERLDLSNKRNAKSKRYK